MVQYTVVSVLSAAPVEVQNHVRSVLQVQRGRLDVGRKHQQNKFNKANLDMGKSQSDDTNTDSLFGAAGDPYCRRGYQSA